MIARKSLDNEVKVRHAYEEKAILGLLDHPSMPKLYVFS